MKRTICALVALSALAVSGLALAQEAGDKTVYRKKTVIDFQDVTIDGELKTPEGRYTIGHAKTTFRTLVKMRSDFMPELQKSADNL